MKEETNDLMLEQARSGLIGSTNRAAAKDGKNARNLDAEMRKRRLAKNALLAVFFFFNYILLTKWFLQLGPGV